jgi:hypothetical protein
VIKRFTSKIKNYDRLRSSLIPACGRQACS